MAKSDLIVSLVRAGAVGDRALLRTTVETLMADERAKSHHILADRLQRALQTISITPPTVSTNIQPTLGAGQDTILELTPQIRFDDLVLTLPARSEAKRLVEEHIRAGVLRTHGYEPRHKVLLSGPPRKWKNILCRSCCRGTCFAIFRGSVRCAYW